MSAGDAGTDQPAGESINDILAFCRRHLPARRESARYSPEEEEEEEEWQQPGPGLSKPKSALQISFRLKPGYAYTAITAYSIPTSD